MRKILALTLTLVLLLVMAAPAMAIGDEMIVHVAHLEDDAGVQAACTHAQTISQVQTTYVLASTSKHNVYRTTVYYCYYCGVYLYSGPAQLIRTENHTLLGWQYSSSTHTGEYFDHYYTYANFCDICGGTIYENRTAGCTATRCIDPE